MQSCNQIPCSNGVFVRSHSRSCKIMAKLAETYGLEKTEKKNGLKKRFVLLVLHFCGSLELDVISRSCNDTNQPTIWNSIIHNTMPHCELKFIQWSLFQRNINVASKLIWSSPRLIFYLEFIYKSTSELIDIEWNCVKGQRA